MALNPFFLQGSPSEQRLVQELINEQLKIYGIEVIYIPRKFVRKETILKEISSSKFDDNYAIEAYVNSYDGYTGQGDLLSKFGVSLKDEVSLIVSRERFEDFIAPFMESDNDSEIELWSRPREGDLVYFPLGQRLFEVKFVEHEQPFYQLGKLYVYELRCELFEYEDEVIETTIEEIDTQVQEEGYITTLNLIGVGRTAVVSPILSFGYINQIYLNNDGYGYISTPTVSISPAPAGGINASAIAVLNTTSSGGSKSIKEIILTNAGSGYTTAPTITISGGGGTGAAVTCSIEKLYSGVISYNVVDGGEGYVSKPSITVPLASIGIETGRVATGIGSIGTNNQLNSVLITDTGLYSFSSFTIDSHPTRKFEKYYVQIFNNDYSKIQFNEIIILKDNSDIFTLQKSINSNVEGNIADIYGEIVENNFNLVYDPVNLYDFPYNVKYLNTTFNDSIGIGTTNVGFVSLTGIASIVSVGSTFTLVEKYLDQIESFNSEVNIVDNVTNEMNYVNLIVTHDNTNTYLAEVYVDTDEEYTSNSIGTFTAYISGGILKLDYQNTSSNPVTIRTRNVGFGSTSIGTGNYVFKSTNQSPGTEKTVRYESSYSNVSTSSTIFSLNVNNFTSVKSTVKLGIGSTVSVQELTTIFNSNNIYVNQYPFLSSGSPSGLGTFGGKIDGSTASLMFYPNPEYSGTFEILIFNEIFYSENDTKNTPLNLEYGNVVETMGQVKPDPIAVVSPPSIISGSGTYLFNEIIVGSTSGFKARVKSWDQDTKILKISYLDNSSTGFYPGELVVGTASSAVYAVSSFDSWDKYDKYSENLQIETEADQIVDFSESNPFGNY